MRDAFGGAFMIKLLMIFIILYITFMAVSLNYAKAFRVKNSIINIVEQNQLDLSDAASVNYVTDKIDNYLAQVPYDFSRNDSVKNDCISRSNDALLTERRACVIPLGNGSSRYYKIVTYISMDLPFFNIHLIIPVTGETKIVNNFVNYG